MGFPSSLCSYNHLQSRRVPPRCASLFAGAPAVARRLLTFALDRAAICGCDEIFSFFFSRPFLLFRCHHEPTELTPADKSCLKCSPTSLLYFIYLYILKVSISSSVPGFDISCLRKRCCTHVLALMYK